MEPNPIKEISSGGRFARDSVKQISLLAAKDAGYCYEFAQNYNETGDIEYLDLCRTFLVSWAKVNEPNGRPIDDTKLSNFIRAYILVKQDLDASAREVVEAWLNKIAQVQSRAMPTDTSLDVFRNNHVSHRIKLIGLVAIALEDQDLLGHTITIFKDHIGRNLNADGTSFDLLRRDSLHYHCYTLEPLLEFLIELKRYNNLNLYDFVSTNNSSVKKSVEFLEPYDSGEKDYFEYINSQVSFDHERANAGEASYQIGKAFDKEEVRKVIELASELH